MSGALRISIGQYSDPGSKETNQDFHGAVVPEGTLLAEKGVVVAIADGISTSEHGREAAETAVKSFLSDYYATPGAWSVQQAADKVISATNAWLYGRTRGSEGRYDHDRGFVCTLTALVLKDAMAHVLHVGDGRLYRLAKGKLQQVTRDHCTHEGEGGSVLERALGIAPTVTIDYCALAVEVGDVFILATDGMALHLGTGKTDKKQEHGEKGPGGKSAGGLAILTNDLATATDLDRLAREAIARAVAAGANDNLTLQIVRVDALPEASERDLGALAEQLPVPSDIRAGAQLDDWKLEECVHVSSRSSLFKARNVVTGEIVALKVPAGSVAGDQAFLQAFLMEEWVARRLDNPHLMKAAPARGEGGRRTALYTTFEWVEGISLTRWIAEHPEPDMAVAFSLLGDIARGLQSMHRHQMVHQDLRPDNVLVTAEGRAKLIDFGSTRIWGAETLGPTAGATAAAIAAPAEHDQGLSTHQYTAPEGLFGSPAEPTFDTYSLGVIAYQMLTGKLPYGAEMARAATPAAQRRVAYRPASGGDSRLPVWVDAALKKAVHVEPAWRYGEPSEFMADLSRPNPTLPRVRPVAIAARDPVRFWQSVSFVLALVILGLLYRLTNGG